MKRSKGNRYEFTAQLLFMILGLVFLYSHFCELVALTGWNVLNYVYYFEAIDNFLFFIVPFVQAGVFFLIALAIKERRWDLAAVASALLCINSIDLQENSKKYWKINGSGHRRSCEVQHRCNGAILFIPELPVLSAPCSRFAGLHDSAYRCGASRSGRRDRRWSESP